VTGGFNPERIKSFVPIVRWAALIAVGSLIAYSIASFGPDLSTVMPRLSSLQSLVSHKAEIRGVKLLNVGYKREPINGQVMLVLAGTISNDASQTMRVPKTIDVSLSDENYHELFHTAIQPGMATLGSGESASFHIPIPDVPTAKPHLKMDLQN
jgi:hypothetical protein